MRNKKRTFHSRSESARAKQTPALSGPALEDAILAIATKKLRANANREETRSCTGQKDDVIEQKLLSPSLRDKIHTVIAAYVVEQTPALVDMLFAQARAKEAWAWKIFLELTGLADLVRAAINQAAQQGTEVIVSSEFERSLLESVRELLLCKDSSRPGALGTPPAREQVEPSKTSVAE